MKSILFALTFAVFSFSLFAQSNNVASSRQQTLSIIKPDAVAANHIGEIIARFEKAGLHIAAIKMVSLSKEQAQQFYAVHKDRPFFEDLTAFVSSGPVVAMVLEGDNAIAKNREIMGATDFKKAAAGTIRADFAQSVTKNAVHGSDAPETAKEEIAFFFQPNEIFSLSKTEPRNVTMEATPVFLYKMVSPEQWQESQLKKVVVLSEMDEEFIHLAKEDQLERIAQKYWGNQDYIILKLSTDKLRGRLVYEANPGGSAKYYHLYEGSIPLNAVVETTAR